MSATTLYVGWRDIAGSQAWYPVGRLDADIKHASYRFRYTCGALRARKEVQFRPTLEFPDLYGDYRSARLFAMFRNRILSPKRPDYPKIARYLNLPAEAGPIQFLSAAGGRRNTDSFEVFPKIEKDATRSFSFRFCLWGEEWPDASAMQRVDRLKNAEDLCVTPTVTDPLHGITAWIRTLDAQVIGRVPQYFGYDWTLDDYPDCSAKVVRVNPRATTDLRVLVEVRGTLNGREPMSSADFKPLA